MKSRIVQFYFSLVVSIMLLLSSTSIVTAVPVIIQNNQDEEKSAIVSGFDYIASQMNPDGGIRWSDETSNTATTLRVVLALATAGYPQDYLINNGGNRPIDFLTINAEGWINQSEAEEPSLNIARAGQLLTAIAAANENPHDFGENNLNLVYTVRANYDPNSGVFGNSTKDNVLDQVWAILGLAANNAAVPAEAIAWLANAQMEDGSWNDGWGSFLDTTPLALMALMASDHRDVNSPEVQAAIEFMLVNQQPNGGWQTEWDTTTNPNTTGVMLQAIASLVQLPLDENWVKENGNPRTAILATQQESGSFGGDFANAYSTADAILGLSSNPLYALGYLRQINRAFDYIVAAQDPDGGWGGVGQTIDVMIALYAAGWDPNSVVQNGTAPLDSIQANLDSYLEAGPDAIGKLILAAVISGQDPTNFNGYDLISALLDTYSTETNAFGDENNTWHQSLAILGLYAAQTDIPEGAVKTLQQLQQDDGGWEYLPGFGTYPDNTALAIQSLLAAGIPAEDEGITRATEHLASSQLDEGDWGDSSTTSYVLMALNALNISSEQWKTAIGRTPLPALFTYQQTNGSFVYSWDFPDDNLMATSAALLAALSGNYIIEAPEASSSHFAGLVIDPGEGNVQTACVEFSPTTISGLELLDTSGIAYDAQDGFMNSIMSISNPDGGTMYWSYWYWDGQDWMFKNIGASESVVSHSTIEAWLFVSWEVFPSMPPQHIPNISEICGFPILKDYNLQPALTNKDILWIQGTLDPISEPIETDEAITPVEEIITEEPSETASPLSEQADEPRSNLPIYIIAGVGLLLIILIFMVIVNKRS